ncbi:hypothetical protein QAD02_009066 [Eretmocerus hayati]|uniref:Uncharacterized protein n=1 Tax=Eretmocerus hayati TaxID=131215 RepID=A0ACC2N8G7_9HYME|nr:hypothetical protein QAD02_009066 [Eretmocerus hayati]
MNILIRITFFSYLVYYCVARASPKTQTCLINIKQDFDEHGPLIISTDEPTVVYPDAKNPSFLEFGFNQSARVFCPGNALVISNITQKGSLGTIRCVSDKTFSINRELEEIKNIACKSRAKSKVQKTNEKCATQAQIHRIGFEVDEQFLETIEFCHSNTLGHTFWSHGIVVPAIAGRQTKGRKNDFGLGSLFVAIPIKQAYKRTQQYETFLNLFARDRNATERYLPSNGGDQYFAKGHLVANADEFYQAEQDSTFLYANVVPMWQQVNNGNWKVIEGLVRRLAGEKGTSLDVWTGGIGILSLPDGNGDEVEIFLITSKGAEKRQSIPAPRILFKYVYNAKDNEGLVFLSVNNPYVDKKSVHDYIICKEYEHCKSVMPNSINTGKGYSYCCTVGDFMKNQEVKELNLPVFKNVKPLI